MLPVEAALLSLAAGAGVTLAATPVAVRIAHRTGFLDRPVGYKKHGDPTPYLGGSAVLLAFVVAAVAFGEGTGRFWPILAGALALWAVGTVDDRVNLSPWLRVGATVGAGIGLWAAGLGWEVFAGWGLDLALTVVWVLGLVNAFNLMDNLDGAGSTVAGAGALGVGAFAIATGDTALAGLAFALAGACAAFLRFNLARPSRIFLGDGGSMPIGFAVAAMAIAAPAWSGLGLGGVLCAALLVGLAILDTTLVVFSRRRRGISLLTGGRDHLTHRLLGLVGTPRHVAATLAAVQLSLCAVALAAAHLGSYAVLWIGAGAVVAGIGAIVFLERRLERVGVGAELPAPGVALAPAPLE